MCYFLFRIVELLAASKANKESGIIDEGDQSVIIADLNKELKNIRNSRLETGCNCKPIKIDKLSVTKMKAELISGGVPVVDVDRMDKSELTSAIRLKLTQCKLCIDQSCSCVLQEIICSAESCGCLKNGGKNAQPCGNPNGNEVFDPHKVDLYRCQFVVKSRADHKRTSTF